MTINCSRYCNDEAFMAHLNRFRITKGSHSRTEDSIESLVSCLSCLKPEAEIRRLIDILTTESEVSDRGISIHTDSLMHVGSEFEYGRHNDMYFFNSKSIVGLLMALSNALDIRIYIICGSLPLRILHKDEFILQFNYGEESSSKIVIGLVGLTIFHKLNQPDDESNTWDTLLRESKEITESMLNLLSSDLNRDIVFPNPQNSVQSDLGSEEPVIPPPVPTTDPNIQNVTILDFIQTHSTEVRGKKMKIENSAYN